MHGRAMRTLVTVVTSAMLGTLTACLEPDGSFAPLGVEISAAPEGATLSAAPAAPGSADDEAIACTVDDNVAGLIAQVRNEDIALERTPTGVDLLPATGASAELWRLSVARGLTWRDAVIPCLVDALDDARAAAALHVLLTRFSGVELVATPTQWNFMQVVEGRQGHPVGPNAAQRAALEQAWRLWVDRPAEKLYYRG